MVVVPAVDRDPVVASGGRTECGQQGMEYHEPYRDTADGSSITVCDSSTVSVLQNVRESRQSCLFRMCPDQLPLGGRNVVVFAPHVIGGNPVDRCTTVKGKRDLQRKTADTETICSLYYYNFLGGSTVDALSAGWITHIYA